MRFTYHFFIFLVYVLPSYITLSQQQFKTPKDLLNHVDQLHRKDTSFASVAMTIQTPDWTRTLELKAVSKGKDYTLIRIFAPKKEQGITTLRRGKEMWNYMPNIGRDLKVPSSMMMGNWMGSDFTNDDLVKQTTLAEEYDIALTTTKDEHVLTLTAKQEAATVWGKMVIRVDKKTLLPLAQAYFDEKGVKKREMVFKDVKRFGNESIPAVLEMKNLAKPGHVTVITYRDFRFNFPLEESFFSRRNLKNLDAQTFDRLSKL